MPRDVNGTYTLPSNTVNPAQGGTAISATDFNATMDDIADVLTDSLSRTGKGGMQNPMTFADGSAATPSIAFTQELTTGWFRQAAGKVGQAILGALTVLYEAALTTFKTDVRVEGDLTVTGTISRGTPTSGVSAGTADFAYGGSTGETDVTGTETAAFTASGAPVLVNLQSNSDSLYTGCALTTGAANAAVTVKIYRKINGGAYAAIANYRWWAYGATVVEWFNLPPFIDTPGAGTALQYKLTVKLTQADAQVEILNHELVAYEI